MEDRNNEKVAAWVRREWDKDGNDVGYGSLATDYGETQIERFAEFKDENHKLPTYFDGECPTCDASRQEVADLRRWKYLALHEGLPWIEGRAPSGQYALTFEDGHFACTAYLPPSGELTEEARRIIDAAMAERGE